MIWDYHYYIGHDHLEALFVTSKFFKYSSFEYQLLWYSLLGNPYRILDEALKTSPSMPLQPSNAYSNIKDYIDEAEKIAQEAKVLAHEATRTGK